MAPFRFASEEEKKALGMPGACEFCHDGSRPAAYWGGPRWTAICFECSTRVLPDLIADAAANEGLPQQAAEALWEDATSRFWRVYAEKRDQLEDLGGAV